MSSKLQYHNSMPGESFSTLQTCYDENAMLISKLKQWKQSNNLLTQPNFTKNLQSTFFSKHWFDLTRLQVDGVKLRVNQTNWDEEIDSDEEWCDNESNGSDIDMEFQCENVYNDTDEQRHCICNRKDSGEKMIECDKCETWYDIECIGMTVKVWEVSESNWVCVWCDNSSVITQMQEKLKIQIQSHIDLLESIQKHVFYERLDWDNIHSSIDAMIFNSVNIHAMIEEYNDYLFENSNDKIQSINLIEPIMGMKN